MTNPDKPTAAQPSRAERIEAAAFDADRYAGIARDAGAFGLERLLSSLATRLHAIALPPDAPAVRVDDGAYSVVEWAEVHESSGGRHACAMVMRGEDIVADCYNPKDARLIVAALNRAGPRVDDAAVARGAQALLDHGAPAINTTILYDWARACLRAAASAERERDVQGSDAWHMENLLRAAVRCYDWDEFCYLRPKIEHRLAAVRVGDARGEDDHA